MTLHEELEAKLKEFKSAERVLLFNSGYLANLGVISSITTTDTLILSDKLNHASIIDGIKLSGAYFIRYPHCDMKKLEELLDKNKNKDKLIITDAVFSMDGDIAPLPDILNLAKEYQTGVFIDEAHATGVLGEEGRGIFEHFGLEEKNYDTVIGMGTLSKAVGVFGGFVYGKAALIDYLINSSRAFIYTTALPPGICAAAKVAIDIIKQDKARRQRLWKNINLFKQGIKELGFNTKSSFTPIIPIIIGDEVKTMKFSEELFEAGIYVVGIRPPTVPAGSARLRISITSEHSEAELIFVLDVLKKLKKRILD